MVVTKATLGSLASPIPEIHYNQVIRTNSYHDEYEA